MSTTKSTPKDAQVMASILKEIGITDYEPRVLNQMLEFTYRYVTTVLDDAQLYSTHAKKKTIDIDDVRLAIQLQMDKYFTSPPPRELIVEIARQRNSTPLPLIKATTGPRLPPDRYSLTACNYRLKYNSKKPRTGTQVPQRINFTTLQSNNSVSKLAPAVPLSSKTGATLSVVTKPGSVPTVTIVPRTSASVSVAKTTPTPIIKFSDGNQSATSVSTSASSLLTSSVINSVSSHQLLMPVINVKADSSLAEHGEKRKRDDDPDDYDAE